MQLGVEINILQNVLFTFVICYIFNVAKFVVIGNL